MNFNDLNIQEYIKTYLVKKNITDPTIIQELSLDRLLDGHDLTLLAQTGSGKTLAYLIPALERINMDEKYANILVVLPTRELASQVAKVAREIIAFTENISLALLMGAADFEKQRKQLLSAKIIVGTPGRILDHIERRSLKLKNINTLILDEVDEMLDMGFRKDIEDIYANIKNPHQSVFCSATISDKVQEVIEKLAGKDVDVINVVLQQAKLKISHEYIYTHQDKKMEALEDILKRNEYESLIIFANTKKMVDKLALFLDKKYKFEVLHGDIRQKDRTSALNRFRSKKTKIIIATDVASRGIDIDNLDFVINYDLPREDYQYIHRSGRTARCGKSGRVLSFLNKPSQLDELKQLAKIEDFTLTNVESVFNREVKKVQTGKRDDFRKRDSRKKSSISKPSKSSYEGKRKSNSLESKDSKKRQVKKSDFKVNSKKSGKTNFNAEFRSKLNKKSDKNKKSHSSSERELRYASRANFSMATADKVYKRK